MLDKIVKKYKFHVIFFFQFHYKMILRHVFPLPFRCAPLSLHLSFSFSNPPSPLKRRNRLARPPVITTTTTFHCNHLIFLFDPNLPARRIIAEHRNPRNLRIGRHLFTTQTTSNNLETTGNEIGPPKTLRAEVSSSSEARSRPEHRQCDLRTLNFVSRRKLH